VTEENPIFEIRAGVVEGCHPEQLIRRAQLAGLQAHCCIVCLDADRIAGRRHIESAVLHALRAVREGTAIADSLEMEVLLYAGGTRQTSIGRNFGVRPDTMNIYLCFIPPSVEAIREMEQWVRYIKYDTEILTKEKMQKLAELFGITQEECDTVGMERIQELIIERVALLDVYK
jgi:KEOPS complex subunit Cgi121